MNILIEAIKGGFRVSVPERRWTWWVYPEDHEIRNNGPRYFCKHEIVAPGVTLPMGWTLGDVIDDVVWRYVETVNMFPPADCGIDDRDDSKMEPEV